MSNYFKSYTQMMKQARPFLLIIIQQFGYAGMSIISKVALNQGISQSVLVVYRHIIATFITVPFAIVLERKTRPKMTTSVFVKIMLLVFLEPVLDQNLYYTGMKYTTATFATAMCNIIPAFTFLMAWIFRLEKVNIQKRHSQAKVLGTVLTVGGAIFMTMFNGSILNLPWTNNHKKSLIFGDDEHNKISVKGALMIAAACVCCSSFFILHAITLKSYPAELSLTAWICALGVAQGSIVALVLEWDKPSSWSLNSTSMLIAALYSGIFRSGLAYYILGVVVKEKGPVFASAFYPLGLVIVAIFSSFIFSEEMYMGRVIGAIVIILGLYMILWGKAKDNNPTSQSIKEFSPPKNDELPMNSNIEIQEIASVDETLEKSREEFV